MEIAFFSLCEKESVDDIKTYISSHNPNIHKLDLVHDNAFIHACMYTPSVDVLRYIVEELKLDIHMRNKYGNNGLLMACKDNPNLDVIKYLIEDLGFSLNSHNNSNLNAFILACMRNKNPKIIGYLIEQGIPVTYESVYNMNGFLYACMRNSNIEVIDYLLNECGMDKEKRDIYGNTGFILACKKNTSLAVVKHLVSIGVDTNALTYTNVNSFVLACIHNPHNTSIIEYLINETDLCISFLLEESPLHMVQIQLSQINHVYKYIHTPNITNLKKYEIVSHLLECSFDSSSYINNTKLQITSIDDLDYADVQLLLECIKYKIPISIDDSFSEKQWKHPYFIHQLPNFEGDGIDVDDSLEPLCTCVFTDCDEPTTLYGHKLIVYSMIPVFAVMKKNIMIKGQDIIELKPGVSKKIFLSLLTMCYTGTLDVNGWSVPMIIGLIKIIDMYSPLMIDVSEMESYIINLDIPHECVPYLKKLCDLYEFKYLVVVIVDYLRNKK
jgi:ankyrin repeat protein